MYSGIHSIPLEGTGIAHADLPRHLPTTNLVGDPCLVLTTDPKPRLRWTAELHERFVDAITQLGGSNSDGGRWKKRIEPMWKKTRTNNTHGQRHGNYDASIYKDML
ncbi:Homeodomain-like protein [Cynara cardunculus var. scolymus]|uniref:Homeodomain-like protein n=1 Tax=Cynara cardunculus var. scolymus TaxID=59895 RepID=A0A124SCP6_CYNCS|nr:Homeodomain-like protein [Cynara cardunculus var. scolymus]